MGNNGVTCRYKALIFAFIITLLNFYIINKGLLQPTNISCNLQPIARDDVQTLQNVSSALDMNFMDENLHSLDQSDPRLIQYTRIKYLTSPSKLPYNIGGAGANSFSLMIAKIFKNKRNGIFIEAGAYDGVAASNSLYLEKGLGWTGLLVECNPTLIPTLTGRHRKAWIASVCLAPGTKAGIQKFSVPTDWAPSGTFGKTWDIHEDPKNPTKWTEFDVETMPLFSILAALGWTDIDFFSLDIEGMELDVLKEFPFDKIIFKVILAEDYVKEPEKNKKVVELLESKNYTMARVFGSDRLYVHKSVKDTLDLNGV